MPQGTLLTTSLRKLRQVLVHLVYDHILWYLDPSRSNCKSDPSFLCHPAHFVVFVLERISCGMSKLKIIDR